MPKLDVSEPKQTTIITTDTVYTGYSIQICAQFLKYSTHLSLSTTGEMIWFDALFNLFVCVFVLTKEESQSQKQVDFILKGS